MRTDWFPGHMEKFKKATLSYFKLVDAIVVLADARAPLISLKILDRWIKGKKPIVLVLGKTDLADSRITDQWETYFREKKSPLISISITKILVLLFFLIAGLP